MPKSRNPPPPPQRVPAKEAPTKVSSTTPLSTPSSSITGDLVSGMSFGFGSGIGHNAANAIFSISKDVNNNNNISPQSCTQLLEIYKQCKERSTDCNYLDDIIKHCK
jgi:hypothetical protein